MIHLTRAIKLKAALALAILATVTSALAQTSAFTYQGKLTDAGNAASGIFDMQFKLFDTPDVGTGSQQGPSVTNSSVQVSGGIFTVQLDFQFEPFDGSERYLEIGVRPAGSPNPYTVLGPRQLLTSNPYSIRSYLANLAVSSNNADNLGGQPPTAYLQNTTTQQPGTNFNIGGNGTLGGALSANAVNALTQYNIGGNRVLTAAAFNTFVGLSAGQQNTLGDHNTFVGSNAGRQNTSGGRNAFFGYFAGTNNLGGSDNAFFGVSAGGNNQNGNGNSFFGRGAGSISAGDQNSFFGSFSGQANTVGTQNSFFGSNSGLTHTTGSNNTFVGAGAGSTNTTGNGNTYIGSSARGDANIINSTAIGIGAQVTQSESLVLGNMFGVQGTKVGIGITAPAFKLHVVDPSNTGLRVQTNSGGGTVASFGGVGDFQIDASGVVGGRFIVKENGNVGVGTNTPTSKLHVIGTATISGNLSKGGGSFKIDHPLDPENKYLYHSFVESPDMMNIYNGVVRLNSRGEALIMLPDWFEALNKDFRYQLTCIGGFAPVFVAREIKANRFKIAGGKAGMRVSWEVTGIRHDPYANKHRITVEEEKPVSERGSYLHPNAFPNAPTGEQRAARLSIARRPAGRPR